jgi:hypothetical protein
MEDDNTCIVCEKAQGIVNCGCLFAVGHIHRVPGTERFALPMIPHLPLCYAHSGMKKAELTDYAKKRLQKLREVA